MTPNTLGLLALVVLMIASFCTVSVVWELGTRSWVKATVFGIAGTFFWAFGLLLVRIADLVAEVNR